MTTCSTAHSDTALITAAAAFEEANRDHSRLEPAEIAAHHVGTRGPAGYAETEDRRSELTRIIYATPATTIEGFAAKARNAAWYLLSAKDGATPRGELDWDKLLLVDLVEGLCAAGGGGQVRPAARQTVVHRGMAW